MSNNGCQIVTPTNNFNYDYLSLGQPFPLQGGTYFTRLLNNNTNLYIKTKPCTLKQGIVQTEHKTYMDIILTPEDIQYIEWLEKLEISLQKLIFAKRKLWFDNDLELEDIENIFTNIIRPYKSGKLHLIRCNLGKPNNIYNNVKIYNEREEVISYKDIKEDSRIISILEVTGIKFSSRSFNVELSVKQIMLLENNTPFQKCLIKPQDEYSYKNSLITPNIQKNEKDEEIYDHDSNDDEYYDEDDNQDEENTSNVNKIDNQDEKMQQINKGIHDHSKYVDNSNENDLGNKVKFKNAIEVKNEDEEGIQDIDISDNLDDLLVDIKPCDETVHLRNPNEVYKELYLEARRKAKLAKTQALHAFLEAKKIKSQYLLDELEDDSDDENIDMFSENMA